MDFGIIMHAASPPSIYSPKSRYLPCSCFGRPLALHRQLELFAEPETTWTPAQHPALTGLPACALLLRFCLYHHQRRLLWLSQVSTSTMFSRLLGVAGIAAAADYFYFTTYGLISCANNFVSTIIGFIAMAEYFIVAGL
jgi:hypothetical protein